MEKLGPDTLLAGMSAGSAVEDSLAAPQTLTLAPKYDPATPRLGVTPGALETHAHGVTDAAVFTAAGSGNSPSAVTC